MDNFKYWIHISMGYFNVYEVICLFLFYEIKKFSEKYDLVTLSVLTQYYSKQLYNRRRAEKTT